MMKSHKVFSIVVLAALTMMALAVPAFAQDDAPVSAETVTRTLTETQINDSFQIQNPRRMRISSLSVDLQPSQVVIFATHELRNGETIDTITTMVPSIVDGRLYWDVTSAETSGGNAASPELLAQINDRIDTAWRNYLRGQASGRMIDVTISDTEITLTLETPTGERIQNEGQRQGGWWGSRQGNN